MPVDPSVRLIRERDYEAIITCLDKELAEAKMPDNPLDYFVSLNFDADMLRSKSQVMCSNLTKHGEKLMWVECVCVPREPEPIISRCAREAASSLEVNPSQAQPSSVLDFFILGIRTDCISYEARFDCYRRELQNITNFRDFWLSLTFDHDNAVASQRKYCGQVQVTRATCLDQAMRPCGEDLARYMAVSEMGNLPDTCRSLLRPRSGDKGETGESEMLPGTIDQDRAGKERVPLGEINPHSVGQTTETKKTTGVGVTGGTSSGSKSDGSSDKNGASALSSLLSVLFIALYLIGVGLSVFV
ncbi:hypothetical protein EGW08_016088 [Elysia chlorotica]|uniref:Uncharacterized protein n=1 Tax=Elysia chlorotica TaxID=188477 RepID=A0A3S1B4X3_ELYCH|nr:hypothetical protein EGW08_016088 [Elysia chlorotica]